MLMGSEQEAFVISEVKMVPPEFITFLYQARQSRSWRRPVRLQPITTRPAHGTG
jgi:hypothetical protein